MNKFNSKLLYPLVGSIGLTAYLFDNNNFFVYYKNRKLIEDLQFKSTVLVMEHFQINRTYGNILTTTLEHETALADLNKSKNTLKFEMKIKKGKNLAIDDYFANIYVQTSLSNLKWNIDSLDIQFKNSKPKILMRLYESLQSQCLNSNDITFKEIKNSPNLNLKESNECLNKLKETLPFVLHAIRDVLNDENKMKLIGPPVKLSAKAISNSEKVNMKIRVDGEKQSAELYINAEKIEKTNYSLSHLGIMYELNEDYFLGSADLASKYVQKITSSIINNSQNTLLFKLLNEINLSKIIEEKLFKNTRALDSIGRPIQIVFNPEENFFLDKQDKTGKLTLTFNGKLNSAQLIVDVSKENSEEKWNIIKSNLKMIWQV